MQEEVCLNETEHDAWQIVRQPSDIPEDCPISEESRFVVNAAMRML
ncbi:hypothetical protein [Dickeya oryzae]